MPRYHSVCAHDHRHEVICQPGENPPCQTCGEPTERLWISSASVIGDEIPGGMFVENFSHEGRWFYSKQEYHRALKDTHQEQFVRHVGLQGSDKSPFTTRWI